MKNISQNVRQRYKVTDSHQLNKRVVYPRSMRQEEAASRTKVVEEEQLLVLSDFTMVPFSSLGKEDLVVGQLLLIWE